MTPGLWTNRDSFVGRGCRLLKALASDVPTPAGVGLGGLVNGAARRLLKGLPLARSAVDASQRSYMALGDTAIAAEAAMIGNPGLADLRIVFRSG